MSEEAKQKQAEELLQKALSVFGECEPPPDLEERILRQVRAARSRRSSLWLPVLAVAAAVLIVVVLIRDWRAVEAPKTTVVQLPAPVPRPAPPIVGQAQANSGAPAPIQERPIARKTSPVKPQIPMEQSEISPLPQSQLALSEITSSPIEIEDLGKEAIPLVSDLGGADSEKAPAPGELVRGLEEGR